MNLKKMRERRGMTQFELAEKLGSKQPLVTAWETGTRKPSGTTLKRLAAALGCVILIDGDGNTSFVDPGDIVSKKWVGEEKTVF